MRFILIGPIGAGKGTQAVRLGERYGVPHVATGDLLRAATREGTELGAEAKRYMAAGDLVPDELVLELLRERLSRPDAKRGFVLDGFPRNAAQAEALDAILHEIGKPLDAVVVLDVPDAEIVRRISSRRSCPTCGRTYRDATTCELDGATLYRRDDDDPDVIRRRLEVFRAETAPLIARYEAIVVRVDGIGTVDEVSDRISEGLARARERQGA